MPEGSEGHWAGDFEHASITADNRESFNTDMAKFPTQADVVIGYRELQKSAGKPFEFPESMEGFKDDQARNHFTENANKLLGRTMPKDLEAFANTDFKAGLAEGAPVNEKFVGMIKQWAVDSNIPLETVGKLAAFYNGPLAAMAKESQDDAEIKRMEACNEALIVKLGSKEALAEKTELFRRAFINREGMDPDKAERIADAMVKGGLTQDPDLASIMLDTFAPMAAQSSSDSNNSNNNPPTAPIDPDIGSPSYVATGLSTAAEGEAWQARQNK
jgi:hypothetical protein